MPIRVRTLDQRSWAAGSALAALDALILLAVSHGTVLAALAAVVIPLAGGLHRRRLTLSTAADAPVLLLAALAVGALTSVLTGAIALAGLVLAHAVAHALQRRSRRRRPRRAVVVGTGAEGRRVVEALLARPETGLLPVGFVGDDRRQLRGLALTYLGSTDRLPAVLVERSAGTLVLTVPATALPGVDTYALPGLARLARPGTDRLAGLALVRVADRPEAGWARGLRRLGEGAVALSLLLLALPFVALVALLVRLETGSVLARSEAAVRFRTRRGHSIARPGTTWSVDIPGRVGPVGRALRRTRLHELPEALLGLSRQVVGDRPPRRTRRAPLRREALASRALDVDRRQPVR